MASENNTQQSERVWLIGASSGIGEALAREYARRGALLYLSARNEIALLKLRQQLGARHQVLPLDVCDTDALLHCANTIKSSTGTPDRIILLAAAYEPMALDALKPATVATIVNVNLTGAFNTIHAVCEVFSPPQGMQLALCGSVAGYLGLPNGQPYSATKAAVINLAESLRVERPDIDVRLINPGFVRTSLTDQNDFNMPMLQEPEEAARRICDGLEGRSFEIHFPRRFTLWLKLLQLLPYSISLRLTRKLK